MDSLRDSIQKLTRSINPLGKLMDFLQEDVDSMQMELSMWKNSYANTKLELKREEGYVLKHHALRMLYFFLTINKQKKN